MMPRFFLIDPWLANAKGHNYQYALDVGNAAERLGYEVVVGARSKLAGETTFPVSWQVARVFPDGECPRHWLGPDGRNPFPTGLDGAWLDSRSASWWRRLLDQPRRWDRGRRIERFGAGCDALFGQFQPRGEDVLYLPSVTEFEFLCAARYYRDHPWTREHDWHLQFHFNFYTGRDPEFAGQTAVLEKFQEQFRSAVDQIPEHRLHFYATSEAVARQFDALGIAIFHPLPYPVRVLRDAAPVEEVTRGGGPLRVTLPGGMRREKGKKRLAAVVDSVWDDWLATGKFQLVFQSPPRHLDRILPARARRHVTASDGAESSNPRPIVAAPHPMDSRQYDEFIRGSQVGLLMYDAVRYFPRVSGVLCEMLSAGVPVIVPAGCWLADQLAEEHYRHVEGIWRRFVRDSELITPDRDGRLSARSAASTWLARFPWPTEMGPGNYARLSVESADPANRSLNLQRTLSPLEDNSSVSLLLRFPGPVRNLRVDLGSAYESRKWNAASVQLLPLPADADCLPRARVGLVASDDREIPELFAELQRHYEHYLKTARQYAGVWQGLHSPRHTVETLRSRTQAADALAELRGWRACG